MSLRLISLSIRCVVVSRPSPRHAVRMVALAALAAVAMREESPSSRMWLGQLRSAFRRAMAARTAVESALQPTPWLDMLGTHAITSAAVLGMVAFCITYLIRN